MQLVVFELDKQRYALRLFAVERVVRAVEITSLPKAPQIVLGMINFQGRIVSVIDIRSRFRLPPKELGIEDQFIIARAAKRTVALAADTVSGVAEVSEKEVVPPENVVPQTEYVEGVVKLDDGLVLIHDLDKFLSLDEQSRLDASLSAHG